LLTCHETTNLATTWRKVQRASISYFNDVCSERQAIVALKEVKQWKHETVEKTFREGLKKKLKLTIVGMPRAMIVEVANSTREIEKEMRTTHRSR
jgi:hypothetical protein